MEFGCYNHSSRVNLFEALILVSSNMKNIFKIRFWYYVLTENHICNLDQSVLNSTENPFLLNTFTFRIRHPLN